MLIEEDSVLKSAEFVATRATHVQIFPEHVDAYAQTLLEEMRKNDYSTATWHSHPLNPSKLDESTVEWIFLVDLLNFSFWSAEPSPFAVCFNGKRYTGYWSLCACINRALAEDAVPVTSARWLASASDVQLDAIFRPEEGCAPIPMLAERRRLMREAGRTLLEKFDGSFVRIVERAQGDAVQLLNLVGANFHSFLDISSYADRTVYILKRAQILVADLWACFGGESFGRFHNIHCITMFADYRLPQILQSFALLRPRPRLQDLLRAGVEMNVHREEVVELRMTSIWMVELLRRRLEAMDPGSRFNAILIDFYLWDSAKKHEERLQAIPIHRTRSYFY